MVNGNGSQNGQTTGAAALANAQGSRGTWFRGT